MSLYAGSSNGEIVVVTGAAGFLGLKVVELLNTRGVNIQEIRGLDICPRQPSYFLRHAQGGKLRYKQADICNYEEVKAVVKHASVLIHTAAIVDVNLPSEMAMNAVNVKGTEHIIQACLECNVARLVYTSTADVALSWSDNYNLNEATTLPGDKVSDFLFGQYAFTKMQAERKVLEANGSLLANGASLVTCSLRSLVMYGEGDQVFIPNVINSAKKQFGYLPRMGNADAKFHTCYVGNTAWAHVLAADVLRTNPKAIAGKAFFIGDNTPESNFFDFVEPYLSAAGCKLLNISVPYIIIFFIAVILECIAWILHPVCNLSVALTRSSAFSVCKGYTVSWKKAQEELGYQPIFSYEESKNNTIRYLVEKYMT
ncbi:3 beta-hydroxysteroid dehydrogenase/Delta 5--_4-isomerase type 3-like [Oculina patagonica]